MSTPRDLTQDLRSKFMKEYPEVYNAWMGQEVIKSVRASGEWKGEEIDDAYERSRK